MFCLSLLTVLNVGCMNNNFSNRADNQDSQANAPKEVVASNTNQENDLRDRMEQISHAAQGRVGISATVLETGESVSLKRISAFQCKAFTSFRARWLC